MVKNMKKGHRAAAHTHISLVRFTILLTKPGRKYATSIINTNTVTGAAIFQYRSEFGLFTAVAASISNRAAIEAPGRNTMVTKVSEIMALPSRMAMHASVR